ncbi:PREDICTED: uncharacterized protein C1orf194 homolog isoform X2 [Priapulus caudatus]|uniref:Uncharacterized protein C1orf194 homolog isoform X2 n=1 Tax=Priapulus caudatus TaxID=37621 RepID=A0ABM1EZK5_PRICU|nr:PREDICTED: uncharacterized protein C1orf194 homolog isoform X2 [Priapulus caudatus]
MTCREPYPLPRLQNDDDFVGPRSGFDEYILPTHVAQLENPWSRLNTTNTLASARRTVYHCDPQAPRDSIDFVLKTTYDHHNRFQASQPETLIQPETVGLLHGRQLKNRAVAVPPKVVPLNHPLVIAEVAKRESIHSISNAIESHHNAATNGGYSRKHDGGFYCP